MNRLTSIIIPNLNNQVQLEKCLKALGRQSVGRTSFELIVVDNGSRDNSMALAEEYADLVLQVDVVRSPYACRNEGMKRAAGDIIVLLDSNCVPAEDWLEKGLQPILDGAFDLVIGPVVFVFKSNSVFEKFDYLYSVIHPDEMPDRRGLPATQLFFKREAVTKVGFFLPNIRSLGDIEWTNRAYRAGFRFGFAEGALVSYPAKSFIPFVKKYYRLGRGTKELWLSDGKTLGRPDWVWKVAKCFLPPSPRFCRYLNERNEREQQELTPVFLFLLAWLIKALRGIGMIFGKYHRL